MLRVVKIGVIFSVGAVLVTGKSVYAEEKLFDLDSGDAIAVRMETGYSRYWANFEGPNEASDISFSYSDATLGTTLFRDRLFFDLYVRKDIADYGNIWEQFDQEIDRSEVNITGGYQLTEHYSVFLGIRSADTDVEQIGYGVFSGTKFQIQTLGATLGISGGGAFDKIAVSYLGGVTYAKGDLHYSHWDNPDVEANSWGVVFGGKIRYLFTDNFDASLGVDAYHLDFGKINGLDFSEETASIKIGLNYTW